MLNWLLFKNTGAHIKVYRGCRPTSNQACHKKETPVKLFFNKDEKNAMNWTDLDKERPRNQNGRQSNYI